jgi:hypothetical protein
VGTCLLKDDYGDKIGALEKDYRSVTDFVEQIFRLWTAGKGSKPTSWGGLVTCLRVAKLNRLADDIESAYNCAKEKRVHYDDHRTMDEGNQDDTVTEKTPPVTHRNRSPVNAGHAPTRIWIIFAATVGAIIVATLYFGRYFTALLGTLSLYSSLRFTIISMHVCMQVLQIPEPLNIKSLSGTAAT